MRITGDSSGNLLNASSTTTESRLKTEWTGSACYRDLQDLCVLEVPPDLPGVPPVMSTEPLHPTDTALEKKCLEEVEHLRLELVEESKHRTIIQQNKRIALEWEPRQGSGEDLLHAFRQPTGSSSLADRFTSTQRNLTENVDLLKSLTSAPDTLCHDLLKQHGNNIERACQAYFEMAEAGGKQDVVVELQLPPPHSQELTQSFPGTKTVWDLKVFLFSYIHDKKRGYDLWIDGTQLKDVDFPKTIDSYLGPGTNRLVVDVRYTSF